MIIGSSTAIRRVRELIEQVAPTSVPVFVAGESGTGKELVAQTIHRLSRRAAFPFVAVHLAAVPETLLESEVFGHEKGAFTEAGEQRAGCFELANGGTLFIDEVTEMTPTTQAKLLQVLQERRFRRVGGESEQTIDVRIIAAGNAEPLDAIADGRLRVDLYHRLNVFTIALPPLRARRTDMPLLVQSCVDEFNRRHGKSVVGVDAAVMDVFARHEWPGNVRELRNVVERAVILAEGGLIEVRHLPTALVDAVSNESAQRTLTLGISAKTLYNKLQQRRDDQPGG